LDSVCYRQRSASRSPACVVARKKADEGENPGESGEIKRKRARARKKRAGAARDSIARIHLDKPRRAINHPVINCALPAGSNSAVIYGSFSR